MFINYNPLLLNKYLSRKTNTERQQPRIVSWRGKEGGKYINILFSLTMFFTLNG
jgi:hypothetical protein